MLFKCVGMLVVMFLNCFLVFEDGLIKMFVDFKGGKIGFLVVGVEEVLLVVIFEKYGVGFDEVELVNVNWFLLLFLMFG